jgi:tetratricopeptide (TPR) repeat protein
VNRKQRRAAAKAKGRRPTAAPAGEDVGALLRLGVEKARIGDTGQAVELFNKAVAAAPQVAETHYNLGVALEARGETVDAVAAYREAVFLKPELASAHNNLGMALRRLGQLDEAVAAYRQAVAQSAGFAVAHNNLGVALKELDQPDEALAACDEAIRLNPDFAEAHGNRGNALQLLGRIHEAAAAYGRAIEIKPNFAEAHNNLGNALQELGRIDEAAAAYQRALDLKPNFAEAYRQLGAVRAFLAKDPHVDRMTALLDDPAVTDDDAIQLLFALAKAHEDGGDYDRAFDCLVRGNRLKRDTVEFDIAGFENSAEGIIDTFTAPLFERLAGAGADSEAPIFIIGMPRSGTTLVEQIVGSHPDVYGAGELRNLDALIAGLTGGYPAAVNDGDAGSWRALGEVYAGAIAVHAPDSPRITDKMPVNFRHIGLIHLMLPKATIINVTRDGRDTCLSCFKTLFSHGVEFSYDLTELGRVFQTYERLMAHWRAVLPGRVLDIAYEDVVADLEGAARRLVDHCGLAWDAQCLDFHNTERPVRTASAAQVRRPINRDSMDRWRHYEAHLGPLLATLEG